MLVPLLALPMIAFAVADTVPKFDVTASCRGAADSGFIARTSDRLQSCLDSEQRTRDTLAQNWSTFPAADRAYCVGSMGRFEPTYTELATCLEMKRDVKARQHETPAGADPGPSRGAPGSPNRAEPAPQNISAFSSIVLAAPDWMRASCACVSGSTRSMKKRPVTSLAFMRSVEPLAPAFSFSRAAAAILHHM